MNASGHRVRVECPVDEDKYKSMKDVKESLVDMPELR
jgi:hypothetical protein